MSINIPMSILELKGQCVNTITCNEYTNTITIFCHRDKRFTPIDPETQRPGTVNCYLRRVIHDVPFLDYHLVSSQFSRVTLIIHNFDCGNIEVGNGESFTPSSLFKLRSYNVLAFLPATWFFHAVTTL